MIAVDQKVYMDPLLLRQDKMAMASSIDRGYLCHLPLLKLANKIPNNIKCRWNHKAFIKENIGIFTK